MNSYLSFIFKNKISTCNFYIDAGAIPCFIFIILHDKDLIHEFGEDITIKADSESVLPRKDDYPKLRNLRQAIFNMVKLQPEYIEAMEKISGLTAKYKFTFTKSSDSQKRKAP